MAFDVVLPMNQAMPDAFEAAAIAGHGYAPMVDQEAPAVRKVALFEGTDEFGRLQPLLGVAGPTTDAAGNTVDGAIAWHEPTTENPGLNTTEIWEIYNATVDAHPVHLHLVHFEILDRQRFKAKQVEQPVLQHNGTYGSGSRLEKITKIGQPEAAKAVENAP